jgi:hypothetical protein
MEEKLMPRGRQREEGEEEETKDKDRIDCGQMGGRTQGKFLYTSMCPACLASVV